VIPSEWKIFVIGTEKIPLPNCPSCREAGPHHDRERCECLTCHGIYAATNDPARIAEMRRLFPGNPWAVRCGQPSGITVIDAEGHGSPSGVEVLDGLETWTGFALPDTDRIALTPSGGVHRYYRYASGVRSRNRVLPQVDVKSDGGYVVIPIEEDPRRTWLRAGEMGQLSDALVGWLRGSRGGSSVGGGARAHAPAGYDYELFLRDGCPGGMRDEFFNDLIFRLRVGGWDRGAATVKIREHWHRCKQPPDADWYMPWWHVNYKIERVWRTVSPDPGPDGRQVDWARKVSVVGDAAVKVGRVTLVGRNYRGEA
jgi:hypothetical protein